MKNGSHRGFFLILGAMLEHQFDVCEMVAISLSSRTIMLRKFLKGHATFLAMVGFCSYVPVCCTVKFVVIGSKIVCLDDLLSTFYVVSHIYENLTSVSCIVFQVSFVVSAILFVLIVILRKQKYFVTTKSLYLSL